MSLKIIRSCIGGKMRIFDAIYSNGKVYIQNGTIEVHGVKVMSAGIGDSNGILIMAGGETVYVAQVFEDLKTALQILSDGFKKLSDDVIAASGGASDVGGATPEFQIDMLKVKTDLDNLIKKLK